MNAHLRDPLQSPATISIHFPSGWGDSLWGSYVINTQLKAPRTPTEGGKKYHQQHHPPCQSVFRISISRFRSQFSSPPLTTQCHLPAWALVKTLMGPPLCSNWNLTTRKFESLSQTLQWYYNEGALKSWYWLFNQGSRVYLHPVLPCLDLTWLNTR